MNGNGRAAVHRQAWRVCAIALVLAAVTAPSAAQPAPYDDRLNRLAELLGSIHYLRNLCSTPSNVLRDQMNELLDVEQPDQARRARLIASFNRGYRTFDSVHVGCTPVAREAADRYTQEARAVARELVVTYGSQ